MYYKTIDLYVCICYRHYSFFLEIIDLLVLYTHEPYYQGINCTRHDVNFIVSIIVFQMSRCKIDPITTINVLYILVYSGEHCNYIILNISIRWNIAAFMMFHSYFSFSFKKNHLIFMGMHTKKHYILLYWKQASLPKTFLIHMWSFIINHTSFIYQLSACFVANCDYFPVLTSKIGFLNVLSKSSCWS